MSCGNDVLFCISCELIQIRSDTRQPLNSASSALVPEPNNPHDRNAVAVISNGVKVGYIPRRIARTLQPVLLEPRGISWTINLNVLRSDLPDSNDEADDGCAAIVEITASATDDCDALPLLRIQAETVVAAAGSKRLSSSELHSKFIRDSLQLLSQVHAHSDHTVVSPSHAQLIGTVLAQDDAALALLSRLLQRRALWVQASALKLHPTSAALSSLVAIGVVATTAQPMSPQLALSLLPSLNLPLLTKLSRAINAKQAATKGDVLREIHNAAFKQRTLFGGAIDLASAITRCLIDQSPFICVLPSVRRLCGRAATFTFLGVAAPAAVTAAVASEFDEGLHDGTLEGATSRYPLTHSHSGCLPWFKLLPMIDVCKVDRPCDLLMAARPTMPPPSTIICVLSDFEMSDCDFAKDCLSAALWIGGKPSVSHSAHNWTSSALAILMSCAVRGIRNYLHRHACIAQHSAVAQLLSCVLELIPPTPLNFPNALTMSSDTEVFPSLPRALAAAATASAVATRPSHCVGAVPLEAASAAVHALVATSASDQSASSPMQLLQALPHMQPHYVSRFSSINIYCKTLHYLSSLLETEGMHAHACIAYVILLLLPYIRHRRAHWWTRLCINVENPRFPSMVHSVSSCGEQYSDPNYISLLRMCCCPSSTSSLLCHSLLLCALSDDMIDEDNIYCLVQRAQRLAEGSSASESCKLSISTAISSLNVAALKIASEVIIEGRPSNRTAGKKSHFIGFDDSVCVSVEDLALQWYAMEENGRWQGVHCEGAMMFTIFALLMFDIIWLPMASHWMFSSIYVDAPLDLGYPDFYANRKDEIENWLNELQCFSDAMLRARIELGLSKIGQNCRYLSWERIDKEAIISCSQGIGAEALANFCRVVCRGARRAGLPDLMLWRNIDGVHSALAVEVKGPRDSVREEQRFWMHQLHCCGISVEILRVKEPQEFCRQPQKVARKKIVKKGKPGNASIVVKPSSHTGSDVVVIISSDDDVFEK